MDFSGIAADISARVADAINYILSLNISPADKTRRIAVVVESVGSYYHDHLYRDISRVFDSGAIASRGLDDANAQAQRLANKIVRNYALSRNTNDLVVEYYDSVLGRAQSEAFQNARSLQKHPTLTRTIRGETCSWCDRKAGTHTNPTGEDFARHRGCDCLLEVSGFNSRNGVLKNYKKKG